MAETRRAPQAALTLMPDDDWCAAALPLFAAGDVDAVEWSPDVGWPRASLPDWLEPLLDAFGEQGRLHGHGVTLSMLSAEHTPEQEAWLARLAADRAHRRYRRFSEHYGFSRAGEFVDAPPLPPPWCDAALRAGRDRLARLADAAQCEVGLENLAFAFCADDARRHGERLDALLAPARGFLVLDLHNLYCQIENFALDAEVALRSYPLERVREIHVSGGSWRAHAGRRVRRDSHDGDVPDRVFDLLREALRGCPNADVVVLERLGGTLRDEGAQRNFRTDFARLRALLAEARDA